MLKRRRVIGAVSGLVLIGSAVVGGSLAGRHADGDAAASRVQPVAPVAPADGLLGSPFDESTAVEVARDAYTVTERDAAGLMRATVSQQVSSVLRGGTWIPISTDLTILDGGEIAAQDHPLAPVFAPLASAEGLVQVQNGGYSLTMSVEGASDAEAKQVVASPDVAEGTAVSYHAAVDGSDLLFEVGERALYQEVVLTSAPAAQPDYVWTFEAPGLKAVPQGGGEIQFLAPNGEVIFDVPGPVMWDSSGGDGGPAESASASVDYTFEPAGDGRWSLELKPDLSWLQQADRVYPVSIDPDIQLGIAAAATYKEDNWSYNYGSSPRIGNTQQTSTCCTWRTIFQFPLSGYFGKRVIGAPSFVAQWTYGATATQTASLWWVNSFNFAGSGGKIDDFTIGTSGGSSDSAIFDLVAYYLNNSASSTYVMLLGEENDAVYSRKDLNLYLYFTYVDPAVVTGVTAPTPTSPAGGPLTEVHVDNIVMQATGTNNTPGTTQLFQYNFISSDGGVAWNSGWVPSGAFRLPDTALTPGKSYTYTVDTEDSGAGSPIKSMSSPSTWAFHTSLGPGAVADVTVDGKALAGTVASSVARPVLGATVTSPAPGPVWAVFTVKRGDVVVMDGVAGSPVTVTAGGSGVSSVTLPYAITSDGPYTVEVQAFDGHLAGPNLIPPGSFVGPNRELREIPGSQDSETGATS